MKPAGYVFLVASLLVLGQGVQAQYNKDARYFGNPQTAPQYGYGSPTYGGGQQYVGNPSMLQGANRGYYYNQYPYANQPGYGYYGANPYVPSYPALGTPVPINGGMFRFNVGGFSGSYWKSPSGYYYPWGAGAVYSGAQAPVIVVQQGGSSQAAQPPVTDMLRDMSAYIEEQNTKTKFKPDDYQHLARRVRDLQNLESSYRSRNNGTLDPSDEETLRKDCAMLSGDISRRVLP